MSKPRGRRTTSDRVVRVSIGVLGALLRYGPLTHFQVRHLLVPKPDAVALGRAVRLLIRCRLARYQGPHATMAESREATRKLLAYLDKLAKAKDGQTIPLDPVLKPSPIRLTPQGRRVAEHLRAPAKLV